MTRSRLAAVAAAAALSACAVPAASAVAAAPAPAAPTAATSAAAVRLPVWALLDGDTPVRGGKVSVYAGRLPARGTPRTPLRLVGGVRAARTNGRGVALLRLQRLPKNFTVVVSAGRVDRRAMRGALSTQVRGYRKATGEIVYVNPVSTLIEAWRRIDPGVSASKAQRTIYRALGIPQWVDAADLRSNDRWVDARVLLRQVRVHGSIDALTNSLVIEVRRGGRTIRFTAPAARARASAVAQPTISELVKRGLKDLGTGLLGGVAGGGAMYAASQLLHAIGLDGFADFLMPQVAILEQLRVIQGQLTDLKVLVEGGIQATAQSDYAQKAARVAPIVADVKTLMEHLAFLTSMDPRDPGRSAYAANLGSDIKQQLVSNGFADAELDAQLNSPGPYAYGLLQSASAYMGSRKPFFTPDSSAAVQAVFDSYQLVQLQMAILLSNYRMTLPATSPAAINADVVEKISANIEQQRTLMKPPVPAGHFVDLRTDGDHPEMLLWSPSKWVPGASLEPSCTSQDGRRTKFCDPRPTPSPAVGFATEDQLKALVNGWSGETPLSWLEQRTGVTISRAPSSAPDDERGFFWIGPDAVQLNCTDSRACDIGSGFSWAEYIHRYDLKDTSKPYPDGWSRRLRDLDADKYDANAFDAPTAVAAGTYFWPVGG